MKTGRIIHFIRFVMMMALLGTWSIPQLASAAVLPIPTGPLSNGPNTVPDYYTTANWANSPPLAKFVDTLPLLNKTNNLGQMLPVAVADTTTYPGSDYYVIGLLQYTEKMHSDLQPTTLRGYVQLNDDGANGKNYTYKNGVGPHYLGPIIVAQRDRPVRIKFVNMLPSGSGGDLFIPTDTSVMGAGPGPAYSNGAPCNNTVLNNANGCASYTQNRASVHLHGGRTPWISDGTPHQWIVPADDFDSPSNPFKQGASMQNVPDMPVPGKGEATYYFTNQQSARLMFYHDHAWGITRLNVYAGEAAGYVITDEFEQDLKTRGLLPPDSNTIPLILQDKTFVDATPTTKYIYNPNTGLFDTPITVPKVRETDPLWNWGSAAPVNGIVPPVTGDLWLPHVYMPAQSSVAGYGGVNPYGRWMYGPWFYPATVVEQGPVPNPYYDPNCSSSNVFELAQCQTPGQPEQIPGTPNVSMGMEAFQDSAVVNGTVFPTVTVDPRAYRFRVLNAASDRFFNLSFYIADSTPENVSPAPGVNVAGRSNQTEVKMVTASQELADAAAANGNPWPVDWPVDGRDGGVPDPAFKGPSFLQIATESGFLPKPVVIEPQPITYVTDPTAFWVGNVDKMGLAVGPAERADVIVDFSQYAGKTLILYNDAPAAWPARVPGYDYYTNAPDLRDSGGFGAGGTFNQETGAWEGGHGPLPGYAPNTRTVMQVIVRDSGSAVDSSYNFDPVALESEFTTPAVAGPYAGKTLFERAQDPIIVGQAAYASAYPNSYFPTNFPWEGINQINDHFLQFVTIAGEKVKVTTEPKGIHDEMGASFDPIYGRMSGNLAMQLPNPTTLTANLILYGFSDIPTENVNNSTTVDLQVMPNADSSLPGTLADGTQIWKISHNGVDTHPIHFHIFDVQLINRVGWDGQILMPEPNELGWKEVVKISPLEDTIVAIRPRAPDLPFGIPNSLRPLNPGIPIDSTMGFNNVDWTTGAARTPAVTNVMYDFGWEYVWHCHILSHEEMDMMRPIVVNYVAELPPAFSVTASGTGTTRTITWNDPTPVDNTNYSTYGNPANEIGFNVYRILTTASASTPFTKLNNTMLRANTTTFTDTTAANNARYYYKVEAVNAAGSTLAFTSPMTVTLATTGTLTAPANLVLTATVTGKPSNVSFTKVEFFDGTTYLGQDSTPNSTPYRFNWNNVPAGTYSLTVKITDSRGGITVSAPITRTVSGSITPDFTAVGSANAADIGFCETVTLTSTSTTSSGTITGFSWLINGVNYTTNPVVTDLPVGVNPVTLAVVKAATGETAQVTKNVTIINTPPVANANGPYTVSSGGTVTLNGTGTDADPCDELTYAWNVDNVGAYDYFTANPTISYNTLKKVLGVGTFTMTFKVTDSHGAVSTATTTLTIVGPAVLTAPTMPFTFTSSSQTFTWNNVGAMNYGLDVGTSAGASNISSYRGTATTTTVTTLPANGSTVYVRLWTNFGPGWVYNDYTFTAVSRAALTTPAMPFTFTSSTQTFTWNDVGAMNYGFDVGTSAGASNIYSYRGTATSRTVTTLPTNGSTVYVRVWTNFGPGWVYNDYTFTAVSRAALTVPSMPFTFTSSTQTFTWNDVGALNYGLDVGTSAGTSNIYSYRGAATSRTVTTLPTNGSTVYVRVWTNFGLGWVYNDYTFTAVSQAVLITPTMPFTFTSASQTFTWNNVGALNYGLDVGTSAGASDIYTYRGAATSRTVTTLPTNGSTVYVRVWTNFGPGWVYNDYTFTAF